MKDPGQFVVAVCQIGAERALKQEVKSAHPELRSAFARPGLVTWKRAASPLGREAEARFTLRSVFARAYAAAVGPAVDVEAALAAAERVRGDGPPLRLHVFPRDAHGPGEEPSRDRGEPADSARAAALRSALIAGAARPFLDGDVAEIGEHVLDVVVAPPLDEPLFIGHHVHSRAHSRWAGGRIPVEVPADAPSRAYRKIEEAIAWSGISPRAGQLAVEVGSAPGGASLALLRRGLRVVGIDPGAMADVVLAAPRFHHLKAAVGDVQRADLLAVAPRADWLLLDVNLAPQVALHAVRGILSALRPSLRGALFTLKLNDWGMAAEIPALLRRMAEMGLADVRATQLVSNRQELFAFGRGRAAR